MAAAVPLAPNKARERAWGWLLTEYHSRGRHCDRCMTEVFSAADNTGYHSRGRRCDRCMTEMFAAADNTGYHSRGRRGCSAVGRKGLARRNICDRAGGGNRSSDVQTATKGVAESVKLPWLSRRAHLRLMPGSSASLAPDSRSRAAVMFPINFHRAVLSPKNKNSTNQCTNLDYFCSRRPCPPTSACAVYKSLE